MSTASNVAIEQAEPAPLAPVPVSSASSGSPTMSVVEVSMPVYDWWYRHWLDATHPAIRLQQAWSTSLIEAVQLEAEFLSVCFKAGSGIVRCLSDPRALQNPAALSQSYQDAAKEVADAHSERLDRASQLPEEFRQRLWEEIC